jgi:gliding motility-associated-like protein
MSKPIDVDSLAQVSVSALSFVGCAPMSISFSGNQENPSYNYTWKFGDGGGSTTANPSHNYASPGSYPVNVYATNGTGCSDSATGLVTVNPSPTSAFDFQSSSPVYYAGMSNLTFNNNSVGAVQYEWDFGNGDQSTDFEPQYNYLSPGLYHITLVSTNAYGCKDTSNSVLEVRLPEDLYVPNAFTPNGDAVNDYFTVAQRNITSFQIYIYDRWGEQVFRSNDVNFTWDGNFRGQPVKQDVYVWVIKAAGYHGKPYEMNGTVTVVR